MSAGAADARTSSQRSSALETAAVAAAVSSFAIAQPLFDLLGEHVEFLIAHRLDAIDLVVLAGSLSAAPALALWLLPAGLGMLAPRAGRAVLLAVVALGVAATALAPAHRAVGAALPGAVLLPACALAGGGAAFAYARFAAVRSFTSLLALGLIAFPALFVFTSPAAKIIGRRAAPLPEVAVAGSTPVVVVVFDQLPLFSLLDANEEIDAERLPAFAELAATADWFRNATTVAGDTERAVPALLTGRYPEPERLPTFGDHPQNLFTVLGSSYEQHVVQTMTDLCPPSLCADAAPAPGRSARLSNVFRDLGWLYLHVLLPDDLQAGLPDVGSTWRDFSATEWISQDATLDDPHASWGDPTAAFERFLVALDERSPGERGEEKEAVLHFLHLNLPHVPWKYLPSGTAYGPVGRHLYPFPMNAHDEAGPDAEWALERALQRHLLQVGYADRVLGKLIDRLQGAGLYEDSVLIVVADHGITFWPPWRVPAGDLRMLSDVVNVPFFVKRPHQREGSVSDANVETVDLLPSLATLLGVSLPAPVDGRSLYDDGGAAERTTKRVYVELPDGSLQRADHGRAIPGRRLSVNRVRRVLGLDTALGLFSIGEHRDWIGRPVAELPRTGGARSEVEVELLEAFADVDLGSGFLPAHVTGSLRAPRGERPPVRVAIALNGVVWAVTRTFTNAGGASGFSAMVPEAAFRNGRNEVDVFAVRGRGAEAALIDTEERDRGRLVLERGPDGTASLVDAGGRRIRVVEGALVGAINSRGPMLRGWARVADGERRPDSVAVFANGRFYEERDLSGAHAGSAARAHFGDEDRQTLVFDLVIPFELLRAVERPELRAFAISGDVASELEPVPGFAYRGRERPATPAGGD